MEPLFKVKVTNLKTGDEFITPVFAIDTDDDRFLIYDPNVGFDWIYFGGYMEKHDNHRITYIGGAE